MMGHCEWEGWHEFIVSRKELAANDLFNEMVRWLADNCPAKDRRMRSVGRKRYQIKIREDMIATLFKLRFA